ncbi:MAG: 4-(cytidine 5'-diphospho)-2-C-methyl-D-erythritol kinase [Acidobacteriia bacterium]|nr:4-(cytidine 5'-diphospho)-2-C-methyl-D-erythritol kinase [Terriglobia bacterium]
MARQAVRQPLERSARVRALAKINLDLRVLGKRADGYHELRTVFQTISLADRLEISFVPGRKKLVEIIDPLEIPKNLAGEAAAMVLDAMGTKGRVSIRLNKRIPMGAGLGGGSSDAAAVLLALPALAGRELPLARLCELAAALGSDVPFFLWGGRAIGIGRGTELFPLPDGPSRAGILITPPVQVSTAEAYRELSGGLTTELQDRKIMGFQSLVWDGGVSREVQNDFEPVVFARERSLARLKGRLLRAGAGTALMSGSGSSLFGLFADSASARTALNSFGRDRAHPISLVNRAQYRGIWWRALKEHIEPKTWPPRSRYAQ